LEIGAGGRIKAFAKLDKGNGLLERASMRAMPRVLAINPRRIGAAGPRHGDGLPEARSPLCANACGCHAI